MIYNDIYIYPCIYELDSRLMEMREHVLYEMKWIIFLIIIIRPSLKVQNALRVPYRCLFH